MACSLACSLACRRTLHTRSPTSCQVSRVRLSHLVIREVRHIETKPCQFLIHHYLVLFGLRLVWQIDVRLLRRSRSCVWTVISRFSPNMSPKWAPNEPNMSQTWAQNEPKWVKNEPKWAKDGGEPKVKSRMNQEKSDKIAPVYEPSFPSAHMSPSDAAIAVIRYLVAPKSFFEGKSSFFEGRIFIFYWRIVEESSFSIEEFSFID